MFEFARAASKNAPDGSLLHTLIVQAHTERWLYAVAFDNDPNRDSDPDSDDYYQSQAVRDEILTAHDVITPIPRT